VQQANSVFAGRTGPKGASVDSASQNGCTNCGNGNGMLGDSPSNEDQGSNFFGVSHFPCCITNFPQVGCTD
jgi:hypothetical protein